MPAIIFSRICALSVTYDVFAVSNLPTDMSIYADSRDPSVRTAFLLPSRIADARVALYGDASTPASLALAAGEFMVNVRGLPLSDVEIELSDKIYKVISDGKNGKCAVLVPKCKLIYANKDEKIDNVTICVSKIATCDGAVFVCECSDFSHFEDNLLLRVALELSDSTPYGAVAFSRCEGGISLKYRFTSPKTDAPLIAALAASRAAGLGTVSSFMSAWVGDIRFALSDACSQVCVSANDPPPLTFIAPDNF